MKAINYSKWGLILLVTMLAGVEEAFSATKHVVGGNQGWVESTDFNQWASGQTFRVGDQLVFNYSPGLHSVVELGSESDYKSCDITNSLNSINGGSDVVKLDKVGTRYFVCGTSGHCSQGMKLKVNVVASDASPSSSSSSSTTESSSAVLNQSVVSAALLLVSSFLISFYVF